MVGGVGLILTIMGLVISALGFWFTIYQVKKTRDAAEAAKAKADELKNQAGVFDVSVEVSRATNSLRQVLAFIRSKNIQLTLSPLEDAQGYLNRISRLLVDDAEVSLQAREDAEFLLHQIQQIDDSIDKEISFDAVDLVARARRIINMLDSKLIDFQKGIYDA